jgi:apolipoprotein N-acyltransferase
MTIVTLGLAGLMLMLSMGRWSVGIAAWLAPVLMLRFVHTTPAPLGLAAGALVYMVAYTVGWHRVIPFGGPVYVLLMAGVGLLHFLPFIYDRLLAPRIPGFAATLVFPLAFTVVEYLITQLGYGSWTHVAYTQYGNLPLLQSLSVTGLSGIAFLIGWVASTLSWAWGRQVSGLDVRAGLAITLGVVAATYLLGAMRMAFFPPKAESVRVATVTADNTDAFQMVWGPLQRGRTLTHESAEAARLTTFGLHDRLFAATEQEARAGARLVLWSEGNAMVLKDDEPALIERGQRFAQQHQVYLFISLAAVTPGEPLVENKTVGIDPGGRVLGSYMKSHPTPVEGSVPGNGIMPVVDSELGRIGWAICYDYDFPSLIRQAGRAGVDILLNPSWDSRPMAPLHTRMATFRAIENGASMLRPTNEGLSVAVDYQGSVLSAMDHYITPGMEKVMISYLPETGVRTIYSRVGDLLVWLCAAGIVLLWVIAWRIR